jgi:hypothetical protein
MMVDDVDMESQLVVGGTENLANHISSTDSQQV